MSDSDRNETFHYRIDGGDERTVTVETGIYLLAAAAVLAISGHDDMPAEIEIWCPHLLEVGYGPYHYIAEQDRFGGFVVSIAVAVPNPHS